MAGKRKALGLVLMAALALGGVTAQGAIAAELHSGSASGTTYLTGDQLGTNQWDLESGSLKCGGVTMKSQYSGTTAKEVTFTDVTYSACTAFGLTAHIDMMDCGYLVVGGDVTTGVLHLFCPTTAGGVTDEVTITPTQGGVAICHIDIPEQTINLNIHNKAGAEGNPDDIEIAPPGGGITYRVTQTAGGLKCGTNGLKHDGKYTGSTTVTAFQNAAHTERVGLTYT
jgi:hypothetical protein